MQLLSVKWNKEFFWKLNFYLFFFWEIKSYFFRKTFDLKPKRNLCQTAAEVNKPRWHKKFKRSNETKHIVYA